MTRLLLLGPESNVEKGLIGGATISFGYLTSYFAKSTTHTLKVINTKKYFGSLSGLRNMIYIFLRLCQYSPTSDVIFLNSSRGGTKLLAPLIYIMARIFYAKFVFRPFGGDIKDYTQDYSTFFKWIFKKTTLKADILYLQTKSLMEFYSNMNVNALQLPTSRKNLINIGLGNKEFKKRFIYLGFVNKDKGISQLVEAAEKLGEEYTVHIYGPIKDENFANLSSKIYKGVLVKEKVIETLQSYDVLVLPTYYEGEGYPGAIIESYSLGIPVIATRWRSIPEIVKDGISGVLIEPKSIEELLQAMKSFNQENYNLLSRNARQYFNDTFDEDKVLAKVEMELIELLKN